MVWCSHCFNDCLTEFDPKNEYISCTDCGKILNEVEYYDGQDEGDAPFSAKDASDTGGYESWNSEGSKGPGEGPEITRYQVADRPDYSKTHVLSDTSSDEEDNLSDIDAAEEREHRGSDIAPGQSASEATDKVVDRKRQSSKINYEALNKLIPAGVEKKPRTESYTVDADGIQTGVEEKKPRTESYTVDADGIQTSVEEKKPRTESYIVDADGIQTGVEEKNAGVEEKKPRTQQTGSKANENVFYSAGEGDEAVNYEDDDYGHYWDPQ